MAEVQVVGHSRRPRQGGAIAGGRGCSDRGPALVVRFPLARGTEGRFAFATLFAAISNADYIVQMWRGKLDTMGSPLAHVGFALTIFGAVISTAQKDIISQNRIGDISTLNEELNNATDLLLMQGDTLPMGPYFVSYRDRRNEGIHVMFDMDYMAREPKRYAAGDLVFQEGML